VISRPKVGWLHRGRAAFWAGYEEQLTRTDDTHLEGT
jgi:hypothetical protein